jgi:hypothetical protein
MVVVAVTAVPSHTYCSTVCSCTLAGAQNIRVLQRGNGLIRFSLWNDQHCVMRMLVCFGHYIPSFISINFKAQFRHGTRAGIEPQRRGGDVKLLPSRTGQLFRRLVEIAVAAINSRAYIVAARTCTLSCRKNVSVLQRGNSLTHLRIWNDEHLMKFMFWRFGHAYASNR